MSTLATCSWTRAEAIAERVLIASASSAQQPIARLITAEEIATVVDFLATPESLAVTGADHIVDGGLSI